jgi:hypothetical protein
MTGLNEMSGLASSAVTVAALCVLLPRRLSGPRLALAFGVVAVATLVPLGPLPIAAYVRGAIGDLSVVTLALLLRAVLGRILGWGPIEERTRLALQSLIVLAALALYPMALGFGPFDPYRLGYGNPWLVGALGLVALAAWFWRMPLAALGIALAVLAWVLGGYESSNLWDYLLDPAVSIYALCALALRGARWLWGRARPASSA